MAATTIKVDTDVRDRLAVRARRHGRTAGDELVAMMDRLEAIEAWSQAALDHDTLPEEAREELQRHEVHAADRAAEPDA